MVVGIHKISAVAQEVAKFLKLHNWKEYTGHALRRTSATLLVDGGGDLPEAAQLERLTAVVTPHVLKDTEVGDQALWRNPTLKSHKRHGGWRSSTVAESYIEESRLNKENIAKRILRDVDDSGSTGPSVDIISNITSENNSTIAENVLDRLVRSKNGAIDGSGLFKFDADRYKKVLWKDVRVGDLIHLSNNEVVPADILLLRSSDPNGLCYIDTGHLDGETNLKQRQVARGFIEKQTTFEPSRFKSRIEVDPPTTKIYRFYGAMIHSSGERVPVGTNNLLLRECLLKNTDYVEGIVVYAGHETKAMLNNGGPRYKRSSLEKQMNQDVIWCVLTLVILCVIGAIGCKLWLNAYYHVGEPFISDRSKSHEAFLAFWTYVIILQILIPLSLYVTLEMCKIIQVYHIHNDVKLYDSMINKRTQCRALNITEELGQIQYIFSDKTGTLTENRMIFRNCSIAGIDYDHPKLVDEGKSLNDLTSLSVVCNQRLLADLSLSDASGEETTIQKQLHAARIQEFLLLLAVCNTVVCSHRPHVDLMNESGTIDQPFDGDSLDASSSNTQILNDRYTRLTESRSVTPSPPLNSNLYIETRRHVPCLPTITDTSPTTEFAVVDTKNTKSKKIGIPNLSFLSRKNGALNLTDEQKLKLTPSPKDSKPIFEAESPDELALVDAAYNYDCKLLKRSPTSVTVELPEDTRLDFEILQVLPFDSIRKCMSVIIRHPITKRIILYCKGADSTVLANMAP
ncbi:hypothetical protein QE152_g33510 [Popillia japonica]|uniref:P-type phospholipid transporter n=1 Tax=Popillia japonica TaxID=7064 RepID=A0AAW1IX08_POPJA